VHLGHGHKEITAENMTSKSGRCMNQTSSLADFLPHYRQVDPENVFFANDELHRAAASDAATTTHQVLYPDLVRLLGIVESLAVACVLAAVLASCASPAARDPRDIVRNSDSDWRF
jgi:hypothetical protein